MRGGDLGERRVEGGEGCWFVLKRERQKKKGRLRSKFFVFVEDRISFSLPLSDSLTFSYLSPLPSLLPRRQHSSQRLLRAWGKKKAERAQLRFPGKRQHQSLMPSQARESSKETSVFFPPSVFFFHLLIFLFGVVFGLVLL